MRVLLDFDEEYGEEEDKFWDIKIDEENEIFWVKGWLSDEDVMKVVVVEEDYWCKKMEKKLE